MSVNVGARLGSLEITALLGKGGMGEVYRARDTKLKRDVAIKILPDEFSRDADRVSRFQREAEVLASLNHPNIAAIYDLQEAKGARFLVLELVEGDTLAELIQRGAIPVEEVLDIGKHICEALEAAHEKGIVHRDLKPANVKITPDGRVKVLDFGLAKAFETHSASATLSNSPTMLSGTMGGTIVGTAAYMSPEQARGRAADQRSDVFAFGCVLFEMLAGQQAFQGEDVSDVLASVIKTDADFNLLPSNLNPRLCELLRRCLAKNRRERWHAMGDLRIELEAISGDPHGLNFGAVHGIERRAVWKLAIAFAVAALLMAAGTGIVVWRSRPSQQAQIARFSFPLPEGQHFTATGLNVMAISPDGAEIVYVANNQLYLRAIGEMEARPIQGTATDPVAPFFSPDGKWVGFLSRRDHKLEKVSITGGEAVPIRDAGNQPWSASWGPNDEILMAHPTGDIERVSPNGGKPESVVTAKPGEIFDWPQFLPGADAILFTMASSTNRSADRWDKAQIVVQSLKSGGRQVLIDGGSDARYVPTGHIVYALGSTLFVVRFDVKKLQTLGSPVPILEGVMRSPAADFSFSNNGSLVYVPGAWPEQERIVALVDRTGVRKLLNVPPGNYVQPRISPNGQELVLEKDEGSDRFVAICDLMGTTPLRRLTFGGHNERPLWSHDGQRIVFASDRDGGEALFWQPANGNGPAELLTKVEPGSFPLPEWWTPDGKILGFQNEFGSASVGIATFNPGTDQKSKSLLKAPVVFSSLSPDGRWLAYMSNEARQNMPNVYVEPFPPTGAKYQVTMNGGSAPVWSPDGKQLYYQAFPARQLVSVDIQQTLPNIVFGKTTPLPIDGVVGVPPRNYDIMPDGKSFVVLLPRSQAEPAKAPPERINVTLNWFEELKQRVPVR
jgi:serine/threonine-protein kinase